MRPDSASVLRDRGLRVTPQRRAILDAFDGMPAEHLAADEVHARAADAVPEISRGTVYATLAELTELGLLAAVGSPEPVRYETNTAPHSHFRCRLCLRLFDVSMPAPDLIALVREGFVAEQVAVTVDGVCADCGHYERGLSAGVAALRDRPQLDADTMAGLAVAGHETSLGPMMLAASPNGIARIAFEEQADFAPLAARARSRRGTRTARGRLEPLAHSIDAYLDGGRDEASDELDWTLLPAASRAPLEAVARIPYAQSRSYERVCSTLSAFDCGYAMGSNPFPLIIPCHRVTRGVQMPESYVGGPVRRLELNGFERAHT